MSNKAEKKKAKAKQKKLIIAGVCVAAVIIACLLIFTMRGTSGNNGMETFSYHGQVVRLLDDGSFFAMLAHNVRKNGTYTKTNEDGRISVNFNVNGRTETGWIINDALHIPREWDDGHGHGSVFPRVGGSPSR